MKKIKNQVVLGIWVPVIVIILAAIIVGNCIAVKYDVALAQYFGMIGEDVQTADDSVDTEYYKLSSSSVEDFHDLEVSLCEQIVAEGTVLLKNENNTLPLTDGKNVSIFGSASSNILTGGTGSGSTSSGTTVSLKDALESAGFNVNGTLWNFYQSTSDKNADGATLSGTIDWTLKEAKLTSDLKSSYSSYGDAAIVVFSRAAGEGADLPRSMASYGGSADQHYLELTADEKALLTEVKSNFDKIIVLINASNAMELGFLDEAEYGIDACLQFAGTGSVGLTSIGKILSGEINPSGRLVDTYAFDALGSPAAQNFGDYNLKNTNGSGGQRFVAYMEGIYVGYKYYETRYEDTVLGKGNAASSSGVTKDGASTWNYSDEVQYAFGYGLSYSEFDWSDFEMSEPDENGDVTVSVTVTNRSDYAGKDVVELYYQSEYTAYDVSNQIEKSAVNLLGFAKTDILAKDASETVEITFNLTDICTYDTKGAGTYILEQGDYYFGVGRDAHDALNNILAEKGYAESADKAGDAALVGSYNHETTDAAYYNNHTDGTDVENQLQFADITSTECPIYDSNYKYLSRNDWAGTFPTHYGTQSNTTAENEGGKMYELSGDYAEAMNVVNASGYAASGNPKPVSEYTMPVTGAEETLELIELRGADFDDPRWDTLLDQMVVSEVKKLAANSGYQTPIVDSISMPSTVNSDGPAGLNSFIGGASSNLSSMSWPCEVLLASTWNIELALEMGKAVGEESLYSIKSYPTQRSKQVQGWYAPAMDTHRTPFAGRNFEYYSEDGVLAGLIGAAEVEGVQSKGMFVFIKHFAFNDQETNRHGVATFLNEQAAREIYLKPFQICITKKNSNGDNAPMAVMTSYNRVGLVWTGGCYNLITNILRNEWEFNGFVLTDYTSESYMDTDQMLAAGGDAQLATAAKNPSDTSSAVTVSLLRQSAKHAAYTIVNSNAMNGIAKGTVIVTGIAVYVILLIVIDAVVVIGAGVGLFFIIRRVRKHKELW